MKTKPAPPKIMAIPHGQVLALRTFTVPPYTTTNTTLWGTHDFIIIDPATTDDQDLDLLIGLIDQRLRLGHRALGIYVTHHHGDHVGAVVPLREKYSLPVFGYTHPDFNYPFALDGVLADGQMIAMGQDGYVRVIYTPGHTKTHVVFYDQRTLVAGDMITDSGTILIPPGEGCLATYLESLLGLCSLPLMALVPAHGKVIERKPQAFLLRSVMHRYQRIAQILQAVSSEPITLDVITAKVYEASLDPSLLPLAQISTLSSLIYLKDRGAIFETPHGFVRHDNHEENRLHELVKQIDNRLRDT